MKRSRLFPALALAWLLTPLSARAASTAWNDGSVSRLEHTCILGLDAVNQVEDLTWSWVGFQGQPVVNQPYYVRIIVGSLGCSGAWVDPEVLLPAGTQLAISAANPVRCYLQAPGSSTPQALTDGSCPTQPGIASYPDTGYRTFFPATQAYWPLPQGAVLYITFPVVSSRTMSGIATNDYLVGAVNVLDNNPGGPTNQWDAPDPSYAGGAIPASGAWQGLFVFSSAPSSPWITYPQPATELVTQTTARTHAHVYNSGCMSPAQIEFTCVNVDPVPGNTLSFAGGGCTAMADGGSDCYADWTGMYPGKLYQFWASFIPADVTNCGATTQDPGKVDFRTLPTPGTTHYTLLTQATGNGSVTLSPTGGSYPAGTTVSATATGSGFTGWTLDGAFAGSSNPLTLTMNAGHTLVASFSGTTGGGGGGGGGTGGGSGGGSSGPSGGCDVSAGSAASPWLMLLLAAAALGAIWTMRRDR